MGVRINKVLNELNIGLQTAIDFLKQRRQLGEVRDDMTPNTKISDEQYDALVKQFGVDKSVKEKAEALFKKTNNNSSTSTENIHGDSQSRIFPKESSSNNQRFIPLGKIDLDKLEKTSEPSKNKNNSGVVRNIKPLDEFNWDEFENGVQATVPVDVEINSEEKVPVHQVINGIVVSIDIKEVVVNIAYKQDGIIPASEFRYNPDLKAGDVVEVYVEACERGRVILSHKKARMSKSWDQVNKALDSN